MAFNLAKSKLVLIHDTMNSGDLISSQMAEVASVMLLATVRAQSSGCGLICS
jgi:hypothetical protein